jgi:hypothetical protein
MNADPAPGLPELADRIAHAGLREPATIALDVLSSVEVIACQAAIFVRPFLGGTRWESYAAILAEAGSWKELRSLLARQ